VNSYEHALRHDQGVKNIIHQQVGWV
jgi:hypothetical protein